MAVSVNLGADRVNRPLLLQYQLHSTIVLFSTDDEY